MSRPLNKDVRPREHLTEEEVKILIKTAKKCSPNPYRDSTMIMVAFIHAFRVSELLNLKWDQIDFRTHRMNVKRLKRGLNSIHPMGSTEIRALRKLQKEQLNICRSPYVFISKQHKTTLTPRTFQLMLVQIGKKAGFPFPIHPHMLRHATGHKLINEKRGTRHIQVYMGIKKLEHTERYTFLNENKFENWEESWL